MGMIVNPYAHASIGYDPDASAFFTAASITDIGQKDAVDDLVVALKSYGVWSKCSAIYPFVGGSAGSHAVNLKSPGTYDLSFNGGITHASTGVLWNGTNGYAQTGLVPSTVLTVESAHLSYYSRTSNTDNRGDIGAYYTAVYYGISMEIYYDSGTNRKGVFVCYDGANATDSPFFSDAGNTNSQGFYVGSRTNATNCVAYKNGTSIGSNSTASVATQPAHEIYIGAENDSGAPIFHSNRECAFASIGDGLSSTEVTNLGTAVQAFQTALSRQV